MWVFYGKGDHGFLIDCRFDVIFFEVKGNRIAGAVFF